MFIVSAKTKSTTKRHLYNYLYVFTLSCYEYLYYSFIIIRPLDAYFNWLDSAIYRKLAYTRMHQHTCFIQGTGSDKIQTVTSQSVVYSPLNKSSVASLSNRFNMNLIYLVLAAVDLAGIFFNIGMLRSCFKEKTKNTFVQRRVLLNRVTK